MANVYVRTLYSDAITQLKKNFGYVKEFKDLCLEKLENNSDLRLFAAVALDFVGETRDSKKWAMELSLGKRVGIPNFMQNSNECTTREEFEKYIKVFTSYEKNRFINEWNTLDFYKKLGFSQIYLEELLVKLLPPKLKVANF